MATIPLLTIPGLWNSGPDHWQTHWERAHPGTQRVLQAEWERPDCADWVAALERAVASQDGLVLLAAHSLGCTLVAHWGLRSKNAGKVKGALLVAPSDVEAKAYPLGTTGFAPMPLSRLPFPVVVVTSTNDEYLSTARAAQFAKAWGARLVDVGARGHLNSASKLGLWPEGWALVETLRGRQSTSPA